jgi:hypothetical protein
MLMAFALALTIRAHSAPDNNRNADASAGGE